MAGLSNVVRTVKQCYDRRYKLTIILSCIDLKRVDAYSKQSDNGKDNCRAAYVMLDGAFVYKQLLTIACCLLSKHMRDSPVLITSNTSQLVLQLMGWQSTLCRP